MNAWAAVTIILLSSTVIFIVGKRFAQASSRIGDFFKLPRDVKGATFDAIASSLPELFVALFAVIVFKEFDVGIGTIAGSALFNLLVIPGLCLLVAPKAFTVSQKVLTRDGVYYLIAIVLLFFALISTKTWGLLVAILFLGVYVWYVKDIITYTKKFQKDTKDARREVNIINESIVFFVTILIIGASAYFLTDASVELAHAIGVPSFVIAFTVVAAATSIPDLVISVANAKLGDIDDATSNVFGSNVFDILVGLGLPLIIYYFLVGPLPMTFDNLEIIVGLLGSTVLLMYFFGKDRTLEKRHAKKLLLLYFFFVAYAVYVAL